MCITSKSPLLLCYDNFVRSTFQLKSRFAITINTLMGIRCLNTSIFNEKNSLASSNNVQLFQNRNRFLCDKLTRKTNVVQEMND
jgi:hypothetical protein